MQNPNKFPHRCCTHYNEKGYDDGYVMLPIFRVRICRNCGECQAVWGRAANVLFKLVFQWFWDGKVHLVKRTLDKSKNPGYSEKSSKRAWEAAASLHPFRAGEMEDA